MLLLALLVDEEDDEDVLLELEDFDTETDRPPLELSL